MSTRRLPERPPPTPPKIARTPATRDPLVRLYLFAEGQTERDWATWLNQTFRSLRIDVVCEGQAGVPATLLRKAKEKAAALARRRATARDEVWIVFDHDEHPGVPNVLQEAYDAGIGVVYSHACFELWPLLHLVQLTRPEERSALQEQLQKGHPPYDHDRGAKVGWDALHSRAAEAVERARSLHGSDAEDPLRNPSTTAWLLHLRCQAGSEASNESIELDPAWAKRLRRCLPPRLRPPER